MIFEYEVVGNQMEVPLLNGKRKRYINLDNASSTPVLKPVLEKVTEFMKWYSSVGRGSGFKSLISSKFYDEAHEIVADFVKADPRFNTVIFTKNASEALNKLANRFPFKDDSVVLTSLMEHHSNDLPWRKKAKVVHIGVKENGELNVEELKQKLEEYKGKVQIVALTGASNVTGWVNPIHEIARLVHQHDAKLVIDAAQLAPHRVIDMKPENSSEQIDFLVFSAHKMYAPFGTGVLIGPKAIFESGSPEHVGGGTVEIVTTEKVHWTHLPGKEEVGSPNVVGGIALAEAIKVLEKMGMENIKKHEQALTEFALENLKQIEGIEIYGSDNASHDRLGVISFNLKEMHYALVSAILSYEYGIGARHGCFCAHPYVEHLLGLSKEEAEKCIEQSIASDKAGLPGAIRISFGFYNNIEEIEECIKALKKINQNEYKGKYIYDKSKGVFIPKSFCFDFEKFFSW